MRYILYIATIFFFVHCSPKVAVEVNEPADESASLAWRSQAPEAGPARQIEMGEYEVFEMDNGLTVIVVENHKLPRVSYQLSLKNNPVMEKDQVGYVSFTGDLIGRGTTTRSKADIDKAIDFIGANLNTSGGGIFAGSLTKHQDALLEIFTDILYNATLPQDEFEKIRTQALSGIQTAKTDPNSIASNVASVVNYTTDHPYGEVQTEETINNITLDKCEHYYRTYFRPNNAYLTIVGDITPEQARKTAEKYFGEWEKAEVPEHEYDTPQRPEMRRVCVANKDGAVQSVIRVTYPVDLEPGTEEALEASVMNSILGGGIFSGRLMQNLREDKGYTYGARSSLSADRLVGTFNASASVRNEVTDSSVHEFLYEMERIATEPVDEEDLQLSKNSMAGSFARSLESPQTIANFARNIVRYDLPEDYYETYLERLENVSVEDIQEIAAEYITPQRANIVVVGNKDELKETLLRFDGDGEIEFFDAFGNKLEMSNEALPEGLTAITVLQDYMNAIGGLETIKAVNTVELHYTMDIMGQAVNVDMYKKRPNMMYMKMGNEQMVMQEMKFDGTTASSGGMGGSQQATEGPVYEQAKSQAVMFQQPLYLEEDSEYSVELKGMDNVEGTPAYKMEITAPDGTVTTEYYDARSNLLIREVRVQEAAPGNSITITQDYMDYQEVDGIMFPYKIITTGAMPVPIEMKAKEIKVNAEVDDTLFIIE